MFVWARKFVKMPLDAGNVVLKVVQLASEPRDVPRDRLIGAIDEGFDLTCDVGLVHVRHSFWD